MSKKYQEYSLIKFQKAFPLAVLARNLQLLGAKIRQKELLRQKRRLQAEQSRYRLAA